LNIESHDRARRRCIRRSCCAGRHAGGTEPGSPRALSSSAAVVVATPRTTAVRVALSTKPASRRCWDGGSC
jgi:hypothetical protein